MIKHGVNLAGFALASTAAAAQARVSALVFETNFDPPISSADQQQWLQQMARLRTGSARAAKLIEDYISRLDAVAAIGAEAP